MQASHALPVRHLASLYLRTISNEFRQQIDATHPKSRFVATKPECRGWPSRDILVGLRLTNSKHISEHAEGMGTEATNGDDPNTVHCNEKVLKQAL
jgi:hypothetical protein